MNAEPRKKLADPVGMIARIRNKLVKQGAVRRSPFCDYIISMRLQGVPYLDIERWLIQQGPEYRISAPTICKQLNATKLNVDLTYAEKMLEDKGEFVEINLVREMSNNIITQKLRLDQLVKSEQKKRQESGFENYSDRRIRGEMMVMNDLIRNLHEILAKMPAEAAAAAKSAAEDAAKHLDISPDAEALLVDLIVNDEIKYLGADSELLKAGSPPY